ncbi:hypothetical protein HCUR_00545 [Holospora curviuscula]|uniref:Uncharacterized protein n=1 Tax=Holospora curviuscula TaxID=1082868 RepID=A0A2S5R9N3_9PROT|nr:hypothetical protein HCUR_00545 [Holospora curviuscula]
MGKWIERTRIKHSDFALPGKKALLKRDMNDEGVLIDATEPPIKRPKKDKSILLREKEKTPLKHSRCSNSRRYMHGFFKGQAS